MQLDSANGDALPDEINEQAPEMEQIKFNYPFVLTMAGELTRCRRHGMRSGLFHADVRVPIASCWEQLEPRYVLDRLNGLTRKITESFMKRIHIVFTCMALLLSSIHFPAMAAGPITAKFGHVAPPYHGQSKGIEAFAQQVREKTNGAIEITTFPFGQLGTETSMTEQVQTGTLEMAAITTAVLQSYVPQVGVLDLPFVFPDRKTAYTVLEDPNVQEKIFNYLPAKGFVGLGWTENEFRDLTNTKREVRTPEDMAGLKIRVIKSPMYIDAFKELGASPVDLPFAEIYSALQNGTIDAQENPLLTSIMIKATEVTKYVTKTNHVLTECIIIVNIDFWDRLTFEQQRILRGAAVQALMVNREVNSQLAQKLPQSGLSIDAYCEEENIKVTELTPEEKEAFKSKMKNVWMKYRKKIGPDMYDFFMDKVEFYSGIK